MTLLTFLFFGLSANSYGIPLYVETFDDNTDPTYVTRFGNPEITGPTGSFASNSLAFNSAGNTTPPFYYDQIYFPIGESGSQFEGFGTNPISVSFDLLFENFIGSATRFTMFFNTPTFSNLNFQSSVSAGFINAVSTDPLASFNTNIGMFSDGEILNFDMIIDVGNNLWDISINDNLIFSSNIASTPESLLSIGFTHGLASTNENFSATTYLDNVVISAVPEPGILFLLSIAILLLLAYIKSWKSRSLASTLC